MVRGNTVLRNAVRFAVAMTLACTSVSCDKLGGGKKEENPVAAGLGAAADKAKEASSTASTTVSSTVDNAKKAAGDAAAGVKDAAAGATAEAGKAVEATKDTAAKSVEAAKDAGAGAVAAATDAAKDITASIPGLAGLTEGSFGVDKLKEVIGNLSPDQLKGVGDKILGALQSQNGVIASLKEQVSKLGAGDLAKVTELKNQLTSADGLLKGLKEKLQVVVDKLKASGLDVSKYTSLLSGN